MKAMISLALVAALVAPAFAAPAFAGQQVRGYVRSDGTYVAPHYRSSPNSYRHDNYSSQGNYNPYTGQSGSQRNEYSNNPQWNDSYGGGSGRSLNQMYGNDD